MTFKEFLAAKDLETLAANTGSPPELYYWTRRKQGGDAEVDYLLERTHPTPLEVKSDKQGKLKSMHQALLEFPKTPLGKRVSAGNRTAWVRLFSKTEPIFIWLSLLALYLKYRAFLGKC